MVSTRSTHNNREEPEEHNPHDQTAPKRFLDRFRRQKPGKVVWSCAQTTIARREESLSDSPIDISKLDKNTKETFLYLAYGSNLCDETFLDKRGIRPLSSINVLVPELRMTFDLPGIPYAEPCFANSARREQKGEEQEHTLDESHEKSPLLERSAFSTEYRKDRWKKGLVGVVYEVTASDYSHIIATEGGGSSYQDVLVDCHALAMDQTEPVPCKPTNSAFRAHTLFAPAVPAGQQPPKDGGRFRRPDPSYAQASARYLKLITDGARERKLPHEYQDYLNDLQPYTITTQKQKLGAFVFSTLWLPFILFLFALQRKYSDDKGVAPAWLRKLSGAIFRAVWASYDGFFKSIFGEGERTYEKGDPDGEERIPSRQPVETDLIQIEEGTVKEAMYEGTS